MIQHLHKDEIARVMAGSGLTPNDSAWLQKFQWTVNSVIEGLGGEDAVSEKYGEMAKVWNEVGPPEELKWK